MTTTPDKDVAACQCGSLPVYDSLQSAGWIVWCDECQPEYADAEEYVVAETLGAAITAWNNLRFSRP